MSEMNQSNGLDNCIKETGASGEGLLLDRCPMEERCGPTCYSTTAKTGRLKGKNVAVMECYFMSKPVNDERQLKDWNMKNLMVIPVVIHALGCISHCFKNYIEKTGIDVKLQVE